MERGTDYDLLLKMAGGFMETDPHFIPFLSNLSALLFENLPEINWAGFYLEGKDGRLVLGPFQGRPACIHIGPGKGVCGAAFSVGETVVVPDVHLFPGHIACDSASRSEIVIPLRDAGGRLRGVLDIDSPVTDRFSQKDREGLEALCAWAGPAIEWKVEER